MIFQNQVNHENSVRKKYYTDNTYFDCRFYPKEILNHYSKSIKDLTEKRNKQLEIIKSSDIKENDLRKRFRKLEAVYYLKEFRVADNMETAKEILAKALKLKPGRAVYYYYLIFYNLSEIPLLYEKLELLNKEHKTLHNAMKTKHMYDLYYSRILSVDELVKLFDVRRLPKEMRRDYKQKHGLK